MELGPLRRCVPANGKEAVWAASNGRRNEFQSTGTPISMQHPGAGFSNPDGSLSPYPSPGSKPMNANSPYSPYSYGGYDAYGFPNPNPGVASSTPPPPMAGGEGEAAPAA